DWHMTNLRNFAYLSPVNVQPLTIGGKSFPQIGQGSGLIGLPGDPTPPSRFVATALALKFATPVNNAADALVLAQKVINRVHIPPGLRRAPADSTEGDYTQWAVFRDHTNRVLYWRTYNDMTLRAVSLKDLDFAPGAPRKILSLGTDSTPAHFVAPTAFTADKP